MSRQEPAWDKDGNLGQGLVVTGLQSAAGEERGRGLRRGRGGAPARWAACPPQHRGCGRSGETRAGGHLAVPPLTRWVFVAPLSFASASWGLDSMAPLRPLWGGGLPSSLAPGELHWTSCEGSRVQGSPGAHGYITLGVYCILLAPRKSHPSQTPRSPQQRCERRRAQAAVPTRMSGLRPRPGLRGADGSGLRMGRRPCGQDAGGAGGEWGPKAPAPSSLPPLFAV